MKLILKHPLQSLFTPQFKGVFKNCIYALRAEHIFVKWMSLEMKEELFNIRLKIRRFVCTELLIVARMCTFRKHISFATSTGNGIIRKNCPSSRSFLTEILCNGIYLFRLSVFFALDIRSFDVECLREKWSPLVDRLSIFRIPVLHFNDLNFSRGKSSSCPDRESASIYNSRISK